MSGVGCQVVVSATGRSLVQRSPTECSGSECDCEASILRRPWPTMGCMLHGKKKLQSEINSHGLNSKTARAY